jgi:phosphoribosylformimino-5-aminoimidazole carboxamide ribotide isomerase
VKIFPAIDLYNKCAVRLYKGDYGKMTVYSEDPLSVAKRFRSLGAEWVHIVDLEGAEDGTTPNIDLILKIAKESGLFVEVGGGIRTPEVLEKYLGLGVSRVILGTASVTNEEFLSSMLKKHGDKIAVGADVKDGYIAIKGWREKSEYTLDSFLDKMEALGVKTVICTDISKDGAMAGTNRELYARLSEKYSLNIIASGGVSSISDVRALKEMNLYGAIIGKAYYTGDINLQEAIEVAKC